MDAVHTNVIKRNGEEVRVKTDIWGMKEKTAISAITSISSDKSEKHISQGLEKVLSGISPKERKDEYTLVFWQNLYQTKK